MNMSFVSNFFLSFQAFKEQVEMLASQITHQKKRVKESTVDEKKVEELEEKIKAKNKSM